MPIRRRSLPARMMCLTSTDCLFCAEYTPDEVNARQPPSLVGRAEVPHSCYPELGSIGVTTEDHSHIVLRTGGVEPPGKGAHLG
jgi:hypothetical protein